MGGEGRAFERPVQILASDPPRHSMHAAPPGEGGAVPPGEQTLKWRIFSPLFTFLVKKIGSSNQVELPEHLRG